MFSFEPSPPTLSNDALANLLAVSTTKCSAPTASWSVNGKNQISSPSGYSYDSDGNNTADAVYTYTYDAENRILSADVSGTYYCYIYDGSGLRVAKATSSSSTCSSPTVYEIYWRSVSGQTIAVTDGSGSTTNSSYHEYIFFAGRRIARSDPNSGNVYYLFVDQIGSTRAMADQSGNVCFQMDYLPYGAENTPAGANNTCSTSYLFTGYERDSETGLDYAFARYYNSREARFMTADPLGGDITDPQTLNKYAYVRNNPVNLVDPFGAVPQIQLPPLTYNAPPQPPAGYLDWVFGEANSSSTPFVSHWRPPAPPPPPPPPKKPQKQSPDKSHQCLIKAAGNFALHGGTDALNAGLSFIPGVGPAAVAIVSGIAVNVIDSSSTEGLTGADIGFTAGAAVVFSAAANEGTIAKLSSRFGTQLAEGIPILGTALAAGQFIYDSINTYNQYETCKGGGN